MAKETRSTYLDVSYCRVETCACGDEIKVYDVRKQECCITCRVELVPSDFLFLTESDEVSQYYPYNRIYDRHRIYQCPNCQGYVIAGLGRSEKRQRLIHEAIDAGKKEVKA